MCSMFSFLRRVVMIEIVRHSFERTQYFGVSSTEFLNIVDSEDHECHPIKLPTSSRGLVNSF